MIRVSPERQAAATEAEVEAVQADVSIRAAHIYVPVKADAVVLGITTYEPAAIRHPIYDAADLRAACDELVRAGLFEETADAGIYRLAPEYAP